MTLLLPDLSMCAESGEVVSPLTNASPQADLKRDPLNLPAGIVRPQWPWEIT